MGSISIHGPTAVKGTYNVIGVEDGMFVLQGNLTVEQIKQLRDECDSLLTKLATEGFCAHGVPAAQPCGQPDCAGPEYVGGDSR
jgi:hypothetical protein